MKFLLKINEPRLFFTLPEGLHRCISISGDNHQKVVNKIGNTLFWIGDLVLPVGAFSVQDFLKDLLDDFSEVKLLKAGGYYYAILASENERAVYVYTGLFNVLPIYYVYDDGKILVSSSIDEIVKNRKYRSKISKKFILEKLIFNYSFLNETIYKDIKMTPGNHLLKIDSKGIHVIRHTKISDWFETNPLSTKDAYLNLRDCFNKRIRAYLPAKKYYLSFTSGFDGRTLLSASIANRKEFVTYSFGRSDSDDVVLPMAQAMQMDINYSPFYLDSDNYLKTSLKHGLELIRETGCMSNFARAHYVYAVKEISQSADYIVTGNFGSELFRAAHLTGVMISPFLYKLFAVKDLTEVVYKYEYPELAFLNTKEFHYELEELQSEICSFGLFDNLGITLNQKFYIYMFEEIFRKYFGPEIVLQSKYLMNRTPFLDHELVKSLFRTNLSSVYSKFYENNPVKRFKGQLLYAYIIKENSENLFHMKTGKGYRPSDLISPFGKGFIVGNYLKRKAFKRNVDKDPFGVRSAVEFNKKKLMDIPIDENFFTKSKIVNSLSNLDTEINNLINVLSLNWYLNNG